jgi:heterotetrameric sarcosine oxidase gamma subunit
MADLMYKSPLAEANTPLSVKALNIDGLQLRELPRQRLMRLQGRADDIDAAVQAALGVGVSARPNQSVVGAECEVAWLGPARWLIRFAEGDEGAKEAALHKEMADVTASVVDATHQYMSFGLSGRRAGEFLARVCSLDLGAKAFRPGFVSRTLFGRLPVLLEYCEPDSFRLSVDQSLARFAWALFAAILDDIQQS